jgi:hydrogenase maturation protease
MEHSRLLDMKTILIGLGNPILGDDGVGWRVIEEFSKNEYGEASSIETDCMAVGGLALMERLQGYDQAILVDAIQTGQHTSGTILIFRLDDFHQQENGHTSSAHDVNLHTALQLGREMSIKLPEQVFIVGIEAQRVYDFSEELSPVMRAAIPQAINRIRDLIHRISE